MQQPYRAFSLRRIAAIASVTLTELTRLRVFYVLLIFALVLIGASMFMARMTFQQEFQVLKDISLGAMSMFTSILAIVATARMLPQDVDDRAVYTILAKPVPRFEYILGKLAGVLALLAISMLVMTALFCVVLFVRQQAVLGETATQMAGLPPEELATAVATVRASTFNAALIPALTLIYVKGAVLASLTLFISTFATSTIFTIVTAVFVYFIGHLQATAREFWLSEHGGGGWLNRAFLALVALLFPDLQLFDAVDHIVAGSGMPMALFAKTAALGALYALVYLLVATAVFSGREL
jgi:ABC-2 type transport system permease protein